MTTVIIGRNLHRMTGCMWVAALGVVVLLRRVGTEHAASTNDDDSAGLPRPRPPAAARARS